MGVAGIALLFFVFSFVKTIIAFVNYQKWKNKEEVVGTIGEKTNSIKEKKLTRNTYSFLLQTPSGTVNTQYEEILKDFKTPMKYMGDRVIVLYDDKTQQYREREKLKRDLRQNPIICGVSAAIFIVCLLIATVLSK